MTHVLRFLVLVTSVVWTATAAAQAPSAKVDQGFLDRLSRAIHPGNQPVRNDLLLALRGLRDPELRPLFGHLASSDNADLRRHGLLGLAELESPPRLNMVMLSGLEDHIEQAAIFGAALAQDLVSTEQLQQMLGWSGLDPYLELVLRGRLWRAGLGADERRISQLTESDLPAVWTIARLFQAEISDDHGAANAASFLVDPEISVEKRNALAALTVTHIQQEQMTGVGGYLEQLYKTYEGQRAVADEILTTWLRVDAASASVIWRQRADRASELSQKLRLVLIALQASNTIDPSMVDSLAGDSASLLVADIARTARAIASGDAGQSRRGLVQLAGCGYPAADAWMLDGLPDIRPDLAPTGWQAIIDHARMRDQRTDPVAKSVPIAAEKLASVNRPALTAALAWARSSGDGRLCQALLVGIHRARIGPIWLDSDQPDWPDQASGALALLIEARFADKLTEPNLDLLRGVARGKGRLPETFRLQAAWLVLRHSGQARTTLARILSDGEAAP